MVCGVGNKSEDIGIGIRKRIVVSFLMLFVDSIPVCLKMLFCDLFQLFF